MVTTPTEGIVLAIAAIVSVVEARRHVKIVSVG